MSGCARIVSRLIELRAATPPSRAPAPARRRASCGRTQSSRKITHISPIGHPHFTIWIGSPVGLDHHLDWIGFTSWDGSPLDWIGFTSWDGSPLDWISSWIKLTIWIGSPFGLDTNWVGTPIGLNHHLD